VELANFINYLANAGQEFDLDNNFNSMLGMTIRGVSFGLGVENSCRSETKWDRLCVWKNKTTPGDFSLGVILFDRCVSDGPTRSKH
jgi:hypothetical protein